MHIRPCHWPTQKENASQSHRRWKGLADSRDASHEDMLSASNVVRELKIAVINIVRERPRNSRNGVKESKPRSLICFSSSFSSLNKNYESSDLPKQALVSQIIEESVQTLPVKDAKAVAADVK